MIARINENWLNKHNGGVNFYNDKLASDLTKQRMSKARLGKPKSESMKLNSMHNFKLLFHNTEKIEFIRGRLNRKDWEIIRVCMAHKNRFLPRSNVTISRILRINI